MYRILKDGAISLVFCGRARCLRPGSLRCNVRERLLSVAVDGRGSGGSDHASKACSHIAKVAEWYVYDVVRLKLDIVDFAFFHFGKIDTHIRIAAVGPFANEMG